MPDRRRPEERRKIERRAPEWDEYGDWAVVRPRRPVRKGLWTAVVVVLLGLSTGAGAAAGMSARRPEAPRWLAASAVGAPSPVLSTLNGEAERPTPSGLASKIQSLLSDGRLGGRVTASVVDVATGDVLYDRNAGAAAVPASTAKLLTAAAVLQARGPGYRIPTRAVAGSSPGEVVLVGGGDPSLAAGSPSTYAGAARLDKLAEQVKAALGDDAPTRVIVDSSLYVGSTLGPGWFPQDAKDGFIGNITALMTDGARRNPKQVKPPAARYSQPDLAAGQLFAKALGLPASAVSFGRAPQDGQQLGQVVSPPISRLVEVMVADSDNMIAEGLARQVALARGGPASFDGAAAATRDALGELGLPLDGYGLVDGSGLSHQNKVSARLLTDLLTMSAGNDHPELRPIVSGLPVAAYSGTLVDRFRGSNSGGSAAGVVRAKTGTLNGVSSLAGLAVDADGRLLAFAVVADAAGNTFQAEDALDRVAAAIASCGCS
jgi:D-alanyl-D-alanine carboxypeptidase/D-alanyl-D-alanine-endopeptidase (penicillin-binding protein 4)